MAEWDGLPLDTPTKVAEDAGLEVIATRTKNGGTVEYRPKPGSAAERAHQLDERLGQAIGSNSVFLALVSPTNVQVVAQVRALTRQVNAMLRLQRGELDEVD